MECNKVQDLILTDYIDNEMPQESKEDLERHLLSCPSCQKFKMLVKKFSLDPFEDCPSPEVPKEIWQNIQQKIPMQQKLSFTDFFNGFLEKVRLVFFPKPRWALALSASFLLIMMLWVSIFSFNKRYELAQIEAQEQVEYSQYLMEFTETAQETSEGYGTDMEIFLLAGL